jgi:RHH-type transcriptional regulator, proline utilization regulon repressor / proline dehydrogenase / delta 1-pyrroline-5-carboxylate dehydrogenase
MLADANLASEDSLRETLRSRYLADEDRIIDDLLPLADLGPAARAQAQGYARALVEGIRRDSAGKGGVDALLNEYALSTQEGLALMCLAEALLRVPDSLTADRLILDKLGEGDWASHIDGGRSLFVNASSWGLLLTGKLVNYGDGEQQQLHNVLKRIAGRLGQPVIRAAVRCAMGIMGNIFVMGSTIDRALKRARRQEARGYTYSYDMLGEGARTAADAERYFDGYQQAIDRIGAVADKRGPHRGPGISVKLSALHPRYQFAHRERVMTELVPRLKTLALSAKQWGMGLTVDAEEAARLDLSLDIIEAVFTAPELDGWDGFGMAVQAYQKRALTVIEWIKQLAARTGRKMAVRLVKGAYWDTEIKLAQMEGLSDYPVFTRKPSTDVCYLACARLLLDSRAHIYPQFATHNAYTVAAILTMDESGEGYEFQRLHGMGDELYKQVIADKGIPCRIYAPVGDHTDLLAYLVRRLLENGANSSFVNNIVDQHVPVESLIADPVETVRGWSRRRNSHIPLPAAIYGAGRINAAGINLSDLLPLRTLRDAMEQAWTVSRDGTTSGAVPVRNPALTSEVVGALSYDNADSIERKLASAHQAFGTWSQTLPWDRAQLLNRFADALEEHCAALMMLCVKEAGKNVADSLAEVREAVDFCRYYSQQIMAQQIMAQQATQEVFSGTHGYEPRGAVRMSAFGASDSDHGYEPRGVVLCISPWNFPLAIFVGQMTAALAAGNTVVAKPAEQTSLVALRAVELLYQCGLAQDAVQVLVSPGKPVGEQLVPDPRIQTVMFTGSTETGRWLSETLAQRSDAPIPLIAETGGQNAMIVDSTALAEQVVDDVVRSGFQSAGQRCSALRVLFLQEEVADKIIHMLKGAMAELGIGDPALLSTDVGPVIDDSALARLNDHKDFMQQHGRLLYQCTLPDELVNGRFFAPSLYEIDQLSVLEREVFGPVVHIIRYRAWELDDVIAQINHSGYGLTLGVHSRVQRTADRIARRAEVGNVYINRDMIGAVVGVQPFGGRGLSGTGPKAGGPAYLRRLVRPNGAWSSGQGGALPARRQNAASDSVLEGVLDPIMRSGAALGPIDKTGQINTAVLKPCGDILRQVRDVLAQAVPLPGPTGELNRLYYEPRGRLVALYGEGDNPVHCLVSATAALACGNRLSLFVPPQWQTWTNSLIDAFVEASLPADRVTIAETPVPASFGSLLADPSFAGAIFSPQNPHGSVIAKALANRPGPLPAIICEDPGAFYAYRFVEEKTVTINTTAAGGNASLMTLTDDEDVKVEGGDSELEPAWQGH